MARRSAPAVPGAISPVATSESPKRPPLVFVSHDSRDAELSEAFDNLLTDVTGGMLKSFRSSDTKGSAGMEFGAEWYRAILDRLVEATDVVALITPQSLNRPWILFETGFAKGRLDTTVFGIAVGIPLATASTGPFAQFQNSADDEDSLVKLVRELVRRNLPDAAPRDEALKRAVQAFRSTLDDLGSKEVGEPAGDASDPDDVATLFEELKVQIRDLSETVVRQGRRPAFGLKRARFATADRLLSEAAGHPDREARLVAWLTLLQHVRDQVPWIYEPGLELYRAMSTGRAATIRQAAERVRRLASAAGSRTPDDPTSPDRDSYAFGREFPRMLEYYLSQFVERALAEAVEQATTIPRGRIAKSS